MRFFKKALTGEGVKLMTAAGTGNLFLEVSVASDGEPGLLVSSRPTFADPDSAIAWSGNVRTGIRTDVSFKTFAGRGSGETFQMSFEGPGWVLIQPSEGPAVPEHTHVGEGSGGGGGGGGIGSLFND